MSEEFSSAQFAKLIAADFAAAHALPPALRDELANRIQTGLEVAMRQERSVFLELCEHRKSLWEKTADRATTPAGLRSESQARANEASWIADAVVATHTRQSAS